jgi:hypothetical protein
MLIKQVSKDGTLNLFWLGNGRAHQIYKKWPGGPSLIFDSFGYPWNHRSYKDKTPLLYIPR